MPVLKQKRSRFKDKKAKVEIDNHDGYATINYTLNSISDEELTLSNFFEGDEKTLQENNIYILPLFKKLGLDKVENYWAVKGMGIGQDEHMGYELKDEKLNNKLIDTVNKVVLSETPELKKQVISQVVEEKKAVKTKKPKM